MADRSGPASVGRDGVVEVERRSVRMFPAVSTLLFVRLMKGEVLVLFTSPSPMNRNVKVFDVGSPALKFVSVADRNGPESVIAGDEVVVLNPAKKKSRAAVTELFPLTVPMNCRRGSVVPAVVMELPSVTVMSEHLTFPAMSRVSVAFSRTRRE